MNEQVKEELIFVVKLLQKATGGAYEFLEHTNLTAVYLILQILNEEKSE